MMMHQNQNPASDIQPCALRTQTNSRSSGQGLICSREPVYVWLS